MYWPSLQDYNEAVQTPLASFSDAVLRGSSVETTALGLPRCVSGNFASVYCLTDEKNDKHKIALRCFLQNVPDQEDRYSRISDFVMNDDLPYTVPFEYVKQGIKIKGDWFPVLKMHWVEGITLTQFVEQNLQNRQAMSLLASYFKQMTIEFHRAGIAHGDLQHDNILICEDEFRLVDYDGMFVPALANSKANELGHRNYQHPKRGRDFFAPSLDNFSSWIIYASLKSLAIDPSLWGVLQGGDDCLLLRHSDFASPAESPRLNLLLHHEDDRIRNYASTIQRLLAGEPDAVPPIDAESVGRALTVVSTAIREKSEVQWIIDATQPYVQIDVPVVATTDTIPSTAVGPSISQIVLEPVSGWAPQPEVLARIEKQLAPQEVVTWQSRVLSDDRWVGDLLFFMVGFVLIIPMIIDSAAGPLILLALVIGWLGVRSRLFDSDRMYFLTSDRILLVRSSQVEAIPFDQILTVEESSLGVTVVLLFTGYASVAGKSFRSLSLGDESTREFFKALPRSVARRRL